jgi:hypothetical protein
MAKLRSINLIYIFVRTQIEIHTFGSVKYESDCLTSTL